MLININEKQNFLWQHEVESRMAHTHRLISYHLLSPAAATAGGRTGAEQWPDGKMGNGLLSG